MSSWAELNSLMCATNARRLHQQPSHLRDVLLRLELETHMRVPNLVEDVAFPALDIVI